MGFAQACKQRDVKRNMEEWWRDLKRNMEEWDEYSINPIHTCYILIYMLYVGWWLHLAIHFELVTYYYAIQLYDQILTMALLYHFIPLEPSALLAAKQSTRWVLMDIWATSLNEQISLISCYNMIILLQCTFSLCYGFEDDTSFHPCSPLRVSLRVSRVPRTRQHIGGVGALLRIGDTSMGENLQLLDVKLKNYPFTFSICGININTI